MKTIEVLVDEHDALPEGCCRAFHRAGPIQEVTEVSYEPDDGPLGAYAVVALEADGSRRPARAALIEESGDGAAVLVFGGSYGLRLIGAGGERAEPFLLLDRGSVPGF